MSVTTEQVLRALGMNPNDPKVHALVRVAQKYDLDLLLGHIMIVQQQIYISHAGLLHIAHRSGDLDGIVTDAKEVEGKWVAQCHVYRKSMTHPFTYVDECGKHEKVRDARKRAVTRAERNALRRAFDVVVDVWDQDDRSPGPQLSDARPELPAGGPPGEAEALPAGQDEEVEDEADPADPTLVEAGGVSRGEAQDQG